MSYRVASLAGAALLSLAGALPAQQGAAARPSLAEPSLSPDRSEIAFVSGGDIWTVPAAGGIARLLVSHAATEQRPIFSPDGRRLAFVSNRTGNGDLYVLELAGGEVRRVTFDDAFEQLDGWSRDGRSLYFSTTSRDIAGMNDVFRVGVEGGTPVAMSAERYTNEFAAAEAPDGSTLALTARGISSGQWWRRGSSHIDESEIWTVQPGATPRYQRLTPRGAREGWPMWGADGQTLYFVSDRGGAQNVWTRTPAGETRALTAFGDGRVLWPSISYDGREMVFERDFGIWRLDLATGQAAAVPVTLRGASQGPGVEHRTLAADLQELALSPDGKKIAFIVRGELFAASAREGGDAERVTATPARESQVQWSPDSRRLVYVSERDGAARLFVYDLATRTETPLTGTGGTDVAPRFSPDGKWIAFARDGRELRVIDSETRRERRLATGYFDRPPFFSDRPFTWSPDSRWVAYLSSGEQPFSNAHVVPVAGGEARQVSFLANVFGNTISWSPDGTYLLLDTSQRTEAGQVARVDLVPRLPRFREDQFRDLFREESPRTLPARQRDAAPPADSTGPRPTDERRPASGDRSVEIVFEGIRRRLSPLPVGVDVDALCISPDGKWLLLTASAAGQQNLYVYPLDELARGPVVARQLTTTPGSKRAAQFSPDSKEVYYLEQGRVQVATLESRQSRPLAVSAQMEVDFAREKEAVFAQAWTYLRDNFYDSRMHGVDWDAVRREYEPQVAGTRTPDEMRRVLALMVGELNASHLGVNPPSPAQSPSTGRLGLRFDAAEQARTGRLRVSGVIPLGPAALAGVRPGEALVAVDGARLTPAISLDALLENKIDRRVTLTLAGENGRTREVVARPVNTSAEKGLAYREWVEDQRAYVERASGGRLGYVHMYDMSASSLAQLHLDLDAENHARQGVVIDVRNNNGGFVNAYALDIFARRPYLTMTPRGYPAAPARTMLGQRALERPTVLVTNQHSLSDAEDFAEGYRALGLGKIVGEPTAGWIIYTSNLPLVDGTVLRIPFIKVTANDGTNMELNPRPVDVPVTRPLGEGQQGRDSQLDTAVRVLLEGIGR